MPTKPPGPCTTPGCPGRATNHGKCARHAAERQAASEARRGSRHERGYGSDWERESAEYLAAHPFCIGVMVDGRRVHAPECNGRATRTDHIVPRSQGGSNTWANYQPLSQQCHSLKTAKYDGGFGNARRPAPAG